jgi:hypothetical protein
LNLNKMIFCEFRAFSAVFSLMAFFFISDCLVDISIAAIPSEKIISSLKEYNSILPKGKINYTTVSYIETDNGDNVLTIKYEALFKHNGAALSKFYLKEHLPGLANPSEYLYDGSSTTTIDPIGEVASRLNGNTIVERPWSWGRFDSKALDWENAEIKALSDESDLVTVSVSRIHEYDLGDNLASVAIVEMDVNLNDELLPLNIRLFTHHNALIYEIHQTEFKVFNGITLAGKIMFVYSANADRSMRSQLNLEYVDISSELDDELFNMKIPGGRTVIDQRYEESINYESDADLNEEQVIEKVQQRKEDVARFSAIEEKSKNMARRHSIKIVLFYGFILLAFLALFFGYVRRKQAKQ